MGSPENETAEPGSSWNGNETQHEVTLTKGFYLKATEVTQGEWKAAYGEWNPSSFNGCGDTCPVEQVNWYETVAYANKLSVDGGLTPCYLFASVVCQQGGNPSPDTDYAFCMDATHGGIDSATVTLNGDADPTPYECTGYRLPTEAEWEYAVRAGTTTGTYAGTSTTTDCTTGGPLDAIAWFCGNAGGTTHPVGTKTANLWGLHDMLGNVWGWTGDWYASYAEPYTDPTGPSTGSYRVFRGGSWGNGAGNARAAFRNNNDPGVRYHFLGFRPARSL